MKVSVIGTGIMGSAMVKRLLAAGHEVTVQNRTRAKAEPLISEGAVWADSPADAASAAEVVVTMVTNPAAVDEVSFGSRGIVHGLSDTAVHAEMSTVAPDSAARVASGYADRGKRFVQAPVSGSKQQIEQATLLILAGGATADIEVCRGAWSAFAKRVWTLPSPEQASALKLAVNMMIGQMILALGQSMTFVRKFEMPASHLLEVLAESALGAPMYASKGKSILEGRFAPNFVVANLLKDLRLADEAARTKSFSMVMNDRARALFEEAVAAGFADEDYSAVVKVLAQQAGIELSG